MIDEKLNRYYTPEDLVAKMLFRLQFTTHDIDPGLICEPFYGGGAQKRGFEQWRLTSCPKDDFTWLTNDVDPNSEASYHMNVMGAEFEEKFLEFGPCLVLTNPPYLTYETVNGKRKRQYHAADFISKILDMMSDNEHQEIRHAIFLLRLSFLEKASNRATLLEGIFKHFALETVLVTPRISFTGDGKVDSMTTAFFHWSNRLHFNSQLDLDYDKPTEICWM